MIDLILTCFARTLVGILQNMPLSWVVRIGRAGGTLFYWVDARHRRVVLQNLTMCLGNEKSPAELKALARETFKRIGENFASATKTASMSNDEIQKVLTFSGQEKLGDFSRGCIGAVGHFGNFEIQARLVSLFKGLQIITTYRGLRQRRLNNFLQELRSKSGCRYFERRTEATQLKEALKSGKVALGLLADQHAGKSGVDVPFFGRPCATTSSPAVLALRYDMTLFVAVCFRKGPGRWELEIMANIPTRENGKARTVEAIMTEVNQTFESAIRRDPANWFWVHNRWKIVKDGRVHRKDRVVVDSPAIKA